MDGYPYLGKTSRPAAQSLGESAVLKLMETFMGKGRNITEIYFTPCQQTPGKKHKPGGDHKNVASLCAPESWTVRQQDSAEQQRNAHDIPGKGEEECMHP